MTLVDNNNRGNKVKTTKIRKQVIDAMTLEQASTAKILGHVYRRHERFILELALVVTYTLVILNKI